MSTSTSDSAAQVVLTFEAFFRDELRNIVRDVYFITWSRDDAIDIAVDAFVKALMKWNRISQYEHPGAWVRKVAVRAAIKHKQRRSREVNELTVEPSYEQDSSTALTVRAAITQLPKQQRAAVILHYYDDLPLAAVGDALGCRESTVKRYLFEAKGRLREILGEI